MSTKIFLGIMLVVLAIAGYVAYNKLLIEPESIQATAEGVSFICQDDRYFMAEFNDDHSEVDIIVDGVTQKSLARVNDTVFYEYADDVVAYLFAGEQARVTDLTTGVTVICDQPLDPNNAPYNFGDLGEGGGSLPDATALVTDAIVGVWQSTEDTDFVREFRADGTVSDRHEGEQAIEGTWEVFAGNGIEPTPFEKDKEAMYVKMTFGGASDEVMYFTIVQATEETLELIYMDRGGVLTFSRMNEEVPSTSDAE